MTTILHFLAWAGVAIIAVFVVLLLWLVPLGLKNRRHGGIEVDPATRESGPVIPRSQFKPFVPPQQPHTPHSEAGRDTDADPAS